MCYAPLNAAHFEGPGALLSFNINSYKDATPPAPPSVHHCVHHIWCTQLGQGNYRKDEYGKVGFRKGHKGVLQLQAVALS